MLKVVHCHGCDNWTNIDPPGRYTFVDTWECERCGFVNTHKTKYKTRLIHKDLFQGDVRKANRVMPVAVCQCGFETDFWNMIGINYLR
jgi:hypothetical protein